MKMLYTIAAILYWYVFGTVPALGTVRLGEKTLCFFIPEERKPKIPQSLKR